jgi:hypothetical protein
MAEQPPKTGAVPPPNPAAPLPKPAAKKKTKTEVVVDPVTGTIRRVVVEDTAAPAAAPRTAIVTPAVAAAAAPGAGAAAAAAGAGPAAAGAAGAGAAAAGAPAEEEEETLVFTTLGELSGEERRAILEREEQTRKAQEEKRKARKVKKDEETLLKGNDVERMRLFYTLKAKDPLKYVYSAEGNLVTQREGKTITIPLRAFSELRPEELEEIETKQKADILDIEARYVTKIKELRDAYADYTLDREDTLLADAVVRLNQEVRELSVLRNTKMYPERWIHLDENPEIRSILLNKPNEHRKMGYDVFLFKRLGLSRNDAVGHYREHGEAAAAGQAGGGTVVLFITSVDDPETGMFHPTFEREFVFNDTKYASLYQAFETEKFKELDDEEMVEKLLGTRSAKTIKQLVGNDGRKPGNQAKLWEEILEAFYTQFKDAAEDLKNTGSARFHMMDKLFGSPEYANALATVRTKLKEKDGEAPSGGDQYSQSVISRDEQAKAKVGAIINNFRRNG